MPIGLEAIAFDIPEYYIDLAELAKARGVDPNKYTMGIGQREMMVATPGEDPVVLAASAGLRVLKKFRYRSGRDRLIASGQRNGSGPQQADHELCASAHRAHRSVPRV